ncbi:MAG: deoxyribodipyrimidine photo-lyase [Elusimicrobiota bacterium]
MNITDFNQKRVKILRDKDISGPVLYWMSREQRVKDNWPLIFASKLALKNEVPFIVAFCLTDNFFKAGARHYYFMIDGLKEVEESLLDKNIPFKLLRGTPEKAVPNFIDKYNIGAVVTEQDPLKIKAGWRKAIYRKTGCFFCMVDGHNIVPVWEASDKQEYAAYTIRPKINKKLDEFLTGYPVLKKQKTVPDINADDINWNKLKDGLKFKEEVLKVKSVKPGSKNGFKKLDYFIKNSLNKYDQRNDPSNDFQSGLSCYLHFGQISSQRVALKVKKSGASDSQIEAFLEELIVRKELSDNFCYYNKDYDNFKGFPEWAQKSLKAHKSDNRERLYSLSDLERANTEDRYWNAAQKEMLYKGKMDGYMRMYWAKKILEWSPSPEKALKRAIYLNDKYELDGRDPNGYAGAAWAIGGVHDRAWKEREIYGKVRYMSYSGLERKFDMDAYVKKVESYSE